jgi:hypothetical protein
MKRYLSQRCCDEPRITVSSIRLERSRAERSACVAMPL